MPPNGQFRGKERGIVERFASDLLTYAVMPKLYSFALYLSLDFFTHSPRLQNLYNLYKATRIARDNVNDEEETTRDYMALEGIVQSALQLRQGHCSRTEGCRNGSAVFIVTTQHKHASNS